MITSLLLENTVRAHGRGLLVHHCGQEKLLTRVVIGGEGQIVTEARTWSEYWAPVYNSAPAEVVSAVDDLYDIWKRYIQSSFAPELQSEYSYRYFQVLDALLRVIDNVNVLSRNQVLGAVLGFECFGIASTDSPDVQVVASTITHAERSTVTALSLVIREQIDAKVRTIAEHHGITVRICACKNPRPARAGRHDLGLNDCRAHLSAG